MRRVNWIRGIAVVSLTLAALAALLLWPYRDALIRHAQREQYAMNCWMQGAMAYVSTDPWSRPSYFIPESEGGQPFGAYPSSDPTERLRWDTETLDPWGNAIWLKPHPKGEPWIRLVSFGPNGVYEDGQGDDVAYAMNYRQDEFEIVCPPGPRDTAVAMAIRHTPTWLALTVLLAVPAILLIRSPRLVWRDARIVFLWGAAVLAAAAGVACIISVAHPAGGGPVRSGSRETNTLSLARGSLGFEHKSAKLCHFGCLDGLALGASGQFGPGTLSTVEHMCGPVWLRVRRWDWGSSSCVVAKCKLPLWLVFLLFAPWPAIAWLRGSHRRARRRALGLCERCGYNLTGNVSGVCPECGTPITATSTPPSDEADA